VNKELLKTAVGSAEYVPYTTHSSTLACVQELKKEGITVFAVETTSRSIPMWQCDMPQPLALVFGNELVGIHPDVLTECNAIVCIPTHGIKNSINVATCVSVIMWEALRQWNEEQAEKQ
jgi:23S rRNA (guanosine2251-2'-O)-methyltransferase